MTITATTAAILIAASAAVAAGGAVASGMAQRAQAKAQAKVAEQQGKRERQIAAEKERDFRRRQRRLLSSVRAAGGARGIEMSTGSPLLAELDFETETELQADRIRRGGDISATRLDQQASLIRSAGQSAFTSGLTTAGSSLLAGSGRSARILDEYKQTNQPTS